jgi:16S rRNA (cytidine1402-2'-O)-methyltransferase
MLTLVPTPIGNIEDISFRAVSALKKATVLFCEDTRVTKKLLSLLGERLALTFPDYKFFPLHSHNESALLQSLDLKIFEQNCLYLSDAGMPGISDPGYALITFCQKNALEYDVLPGANAALVAIVMSGFDTKHFLFYGFLPHKGKERATSLSEIAASGYPTILYESTHRIEKLFDELATAYPDIEIFAVKELTKLHQRLFKGTAADLAPVIKSSNLKGEWVVVVNSRKKSIFDPGTIDMLAQADIPKKEAAKILSQLSGIGTKECYNLLLSK